MSKDSRAELNIEFTHPDYSRSMEIFSSADGKRNPWKITAGMTILGVILGIAGVLLRRFFGSSDFSALLSFAAVAIPVASVLDSLIELHKRRKLRMEAEAAVEAADRDGRDKRSYAFGRKFIFLRFDNFEIEVPYNDLSRCLEYSDGLYLEYDDAIHVCSNYLPARFFSSELAGEIISRLKAGCRNYIVVSPLRAADPPQTAEPAENLFDISVHELLAEAEYTPTEDEAAQMFSPAMIARVDRKWIPLLVVVILVLSVLIVGLAVLVLTLCTNVEPIASFVISSVFMLLIAPLLIWRCSMGISRSHSRLSRDERDYGGRVALYDDLAIVRIFGDDCMLPYSSFRDVVRVKGFVCLTHNLHISGIPRNGYFAIPERALDNPDDFVCLLRGRMEALDKGEIIPAGKAGEPAALPDTEPLREDGGKGKTVLSANHRGKEIIIRRHGRATELIVDGRVYAERKELVEGAYELRAMVGGMEFCFLQHMDGHMQIFGQGIQIAKGWRRT